MIDFFLHALNLKDETRAGWALRGVTDPESVADHSWGTALLCMLYSGSASESMPIDPARAVTMAVIHDIAESVTGDVPTRVALMNDANIAREKRQREVAAMEQMLGALRATPEDDATRGDDGAPGNDATPGDSGTPGNDATPGDSGSPGDEPGDEVGAAAAALASATEIRLLWDEYEESATPTALFVRDMNLIDMCAQAVVYERDKRYDPDMENRNFPEFGGLDEFFATTEPRLSTSIGQRLFDELRSRYAELGGEDRPLG